MNQVAKRIVLAFFPASYCWFCKSCRSAPGMHQCISRCCDCCHGGRPGPVN